MCVWCACGVSQCISSDTIACTKSREISEKKEEDGFHIAMDSLNHLHGFHSLLKFGYIYELGDNFLTYSADRKSVV